MPLAKLIPFSTISAAISLVLTFEEAIASTDSYCLLAGSWSNCEGTQAGAPTKPIAAVDLWKPPAVVAPSLQTASAPIGQPSVPPATAP